VLEPPDDIDSWEDEEPEHFACLFPRFCVMPGPHFESECLTWMDMERLWDAAIKQEESRP
jgi:hypothetical protein